MCLCEITIPKELRDIDPNKRDDIVGKLAWLEKAGGEPDPDTNRTKLGNFYSRKQTWIFLYASSEQHARLLMQECDISSDINLDVKYIFK